MLSKAVLAVKTSLICRVPVETVFSIYMQEAQLRVKKTNHLVKNAASQYARRSVMNLTRYPLPNSAYSYALVADTKQELTCWTYALKLICYLAFSCVDCWSQSYGSVTSRFDRCPLVC